MLLGKGPTAGAIRLAIDEQQMTVMALGFATCGEAIKSFREMLFGDECNSNASDSSNFKHKEETKGRITADAEDRENVRKYMKRIIDPLDPSSHPDGQLLNIVTGELADEKVNVHEAVAKGQEVIDNFKNTWPEGFYNTISNPVVLMEGKKKSIKINDNPVYDQEFIRMRAKAPLWLTAVI